MSSLDTSDHSSETELDKFIAWMNEKIFTTWKTMVTDVVTVSELEDEYSPLVENQEYIFPDGSKFIIKSIWEHACMIEKEIDTLDSPISDLVKCEYTYDRIDEPWQRTLFDNWWLRAIVTGENLEQFDSFSFENIKSKTKEELEEELVIILWEEKISDINIEEYKYWVDVKVADLKFFNRSLF